jgi:hypothetical protein
MFVSAVNRQFWEGAFTVSRWNKAPSGGQDSVLFVTEIVCLGVVLEAIARRKHIRIVVRRRDGGLVYSLGQYYLLYPTGMTMSGL